MLYTTKYKPNKLCRTSMGDPEYIYMERNPATGIYNYLDIRTNTRYGAYQYGQDYCNGWGLVKIAKRSRKYQYIDLDGKLSEEYYHALPYSEGFARVHPKMKNDGILFYRDMAGRVTLDKTPSGIDLYRFYTGSLRLEDIPAEHFIDPKFVDAIIKECSRKMELRTTKIEYDSIRRQSKHFTYTLVQILSIIDSKKKEAVKLSKATKSKKHTSLENGGM